MAVKWHLHIYNKSKRYARRDHPKHLLLYAPFSGMKYIMRLPELVVYTGTADAHMTQPRMGRRGGIGRESRSATRNHPPHSAKRDVGA